MVAKHFLWVGVVLFCTYAAIARYCDFKDAIGYACKRECITPPIVAADDLEEMKVNALKRAYHMNGDSMVRYGSIDISELPVVFLDDPKHPLPSFIERKPNGKTKTHNHKKQRHQAAR